MLGPHESALGSLNSPRSPSQSWEALVSTGGPNYLWGPYSALKSLVSPRGPSSPSFHCSRTPVELGQLGLQTVSVQQWREACGRRVCTIGIWLQSSANESWPLKDNLNHVTVKIAIQRCGLLRKLNLWKCSSACCALPWIVLINWLRKNAYFNKFILKKKSVAVFLNSKNKCIRNILKRQV